MNKSPPSDLEKWQIFPEALVLACRRRRHLRDCTAVFFVVLFLCFSLHAADTTADDTESNAASISVATLLTDEHALNEAHDVELQGDLAFVAGKGGSVAIISIADPDAAKLIWFQRDTERFRDAETVLISENHLFLGTKDFHSIDITDPHAPTVDATLRDRAKIETINGMVRRDELIFAAGKEGLIAAIDVAHPKTLKFAGSLETRTQFQVRYPHDLDLLENYLIVVDPNRFGEQPGTVAVFRVFESDGQLLPAKNWILVGRLTSDSLRGANRVQVRGHFAFVGGSLSPRISQGRSLAKGVVVDLSDPSTPREIAVVEFSDSRGPNGLTIAGDAWFLAGGQTVEAYDITAPSRPRLLTRFRSPKAFTTADDNAHDLVYRDGFLYVTSQGDHRFVILRVNDKEICRLAERQ